MKFKITNRWSADVIFETEAACFIESVEKAVAQNTDLRQANLRWANLRWAKLREAKLSGANLRGADLSEADLSEADLSWANLRGANLSGANLRWANLRGAKLSEASLRWANFREAKLSEANLRWANLREAKLSEADLSWANLRGANLRGANLSGANLREAKLSEANLSEAYLSGANLRAIRDDLWAVLSAVPKEVVGLRQALIDGRVDGSHYQGECACLVGTIANVRHCDYQSLGILKPDAERPSERFFLCINPGDTPEKSQATKLAVEWIDQWLANVKEAFAVA